MKWGIPAKIYETGHPEDVLQTSTYADTSRDYRHELHVFPNYGHQDVFMGKNVARDIFPRLLEFLDKRRKPGMA